MYIIYFSCGLETLGCYTLEAMNAYKSLEADNYYYRLVFNIIHLTHIVSMFLAAEYVQSIMILLMYMCMDGYVRMCVCLCVCARARARVCVCVCEKDSKSRPHIILTTDPDFPSQLTRKPFGWIKYL